jgi:Zn-dependent protease with chaperone function
MNDHRGISMCAKFVANRHRIGPPCLSVRTAIGCALLAFLTSLTLASPGDAEDGASWRSYPVASQEKTAPKEEGGSAADRKLFHEVMDRLTQTALVRKNYPFEFVWPPEVMILPNSAKEFNAYACGYAKDLATGKILTRAVITEGFMSKIVDGDAEILAAIMGHELAHLTKGHIISMRSFDLAGLVLGRDQEIEADLEGVKIAVAAGYPYRSGVKSAFREWKVLGDYSNFEGIKGTHPSWTERLKLLDHEQAQIWKAMAAFQNGYFFLLSEQYRTAETCFQSVVEDFSDCGEAWSNLGYARLMQYCDGLEEKDLRKLNLGQFAAGCFYARPQGLVPTRAADDKMWRQAVEALNKALKHDPNLALAHGNLGLAYLVHPEGKKTAEALDYFRKGATLKDKGLDGLSAAAYLVNFGVAELAGGSTSAAADKFRKAGALLPKARMGAVTCELDLALLYNEATLEASASEPKRKEQALVLLKDYLTGANPESTWWALAFERYQKLSGDLQKKADSRETLSARLGGRFLRTLTTVEPAPGKLVTLSDPTSKVLKILDKEKATGIPIFNRSKVKRYNEVSPGLDVLAADTVLALFLTSPKAPPVILQTQGVAGKKMEIRVGMPVRDLKEYLKDQPEEQAAKIVDPAVSYNFYPYLGLAYRVQGDRVEELVVAQIPRKRGL